VFESVGDKNKDKKRSDERSHPQKEEKKAKK